MKILPAKSTELRLAQKTSQNEAQNKLLEMNQVALNLDSGVIPDQNVEQNAGKVDTNSLEDYEKLKTRLYISTLVIAAIGFAIVWSSYSLAIALNYALGACVGVLYLRQLAKSVDSIGGGIGGGGFQLGSPRIALFIGLVIVATRWRQLQFLPVFLGFLTYKLAILVYAIQAFFNTNDD